VTTRFLDYKKQTRQVEKSVTGDGAILGQLKGGKVRGYEIHMGETDGGEPAFGDDGSVSKNGLVIGTYLHGLFENENVKTSFLGYLYKQKGIIFRNKDDGDSIEELARFIEEHVNMELIYRRIEGV
jgi:adenosylcobyric acid synthase